MKLMFPRRTLLNSTAAIEKDMRCPDRPTTTSPVPWLTSLHTRPGRGPYGVSSFPGNCSGLLIHDLLSFYRPKTVFDPMTGGGTCRDVCRALGISCVSCDLDDGHDAADPSVVRGRGPFDFVWLHPPYWNLIQYGRDPRCLSRAPTVNEFIRRLRAVLRNCLSAMQPDGRLALLMGDAKHEGEYLGLPFRTFNAAVAEGFWLAAPEVIRASHGATSSRKSYSGAFIPRLHDVCLILKRQR